MDAQKLKRRRQLRRRNHVRSIIRGTSERPRLTVFRSSKHIYAQLIDDDAGVTIASSSTATKDLKTKVTYGGNSKAAVEVGKDLSAKAVAKGVSKAVFDRGHYRYHGRIKALADAAREGGLQF
jgi:large subunit ribosomal protein L18